MSTLVFAQNFGGAVAVSLSQTIFTNSLRTLIPAHAPAVDVDAVISAGPQGMRKMIGGGAGQRAELEGLLSAYGEALGRVFYLCAGMGVAAWLFSWGMGWRDIRAKKEGEEREKREREGEDEVKD